MASLRLVVSMAAAAVIVILAGYVFYLATSTPGPVTGSVPTSFTVNGKTYAFTYVATTQPEREAGLMNKKVTNTTTMLFAFPSLGVWLFWMKDTNTSLDMIWVNATGGSGVVVYVQAGAQPCFSASCPDYGSPTAQANYVIEAKAGFVPANGIAVGTMVQFS